MALPDLRTRSAAPRHRPASPRRRWAARLGLGPPVKGGPGIRHDLEGIRAVAVLGVVVYHLRPTWLPGGFAGVDVFFVLSGFFITGLLLRETDRTGSVDLLRFWGRRARRLLPASALVIVVTVLAAWRMTNPLEAHRVARDGLASALFGMNWRSAAAGTQYLRDPDPSPFTHYWSLGVEEQFYLGWPLLALGAALLGRLTKRTRAGALLRSRVSMLVLCAAVALPSFLLALSETRNDNSYAYFGTFERTWQLALGGALAATAAWFARLPPWSRVLLRWTGIAAVLVFYFGASTGILYPGRKALVPALGVALVILAGAPSGRRTDPVSRLLCSTPAQLGGRYSYSWYLWHFPPLVLLPIYLGHELDSGQLVLCALGSLVAAVLTYHLLENPLRSSRVLSTGPGRSLALGAVLVALGASLSSVVSAAAVHQANRTGITNAAGVRLIPQPAAAAADFPQVYDDNCVAAIKEPSSDLPTGDARAPGCRYLPKTAGGDVVLTGDSHAAMWFPAVRTMAEKQGWGLQVYLRNSCTFADITKAYAGAAPCDAYRRKLLARLRAQHPSLVIVAGLDTFPTWVHERDAQNRPTSRTVHGAAARRLYDAGLERSLRQLTELGIHVLVIGDDPSYPEAMAAPDCVLSHPGHLGACSLPEARARPTDTGNLVAAHAVGGVSSVDFTPVFCRVGRCYQVVGNILAYRDYNHLTSTMVQHLRPGLTAAATAAMRGRVVSLVFAR
jgi:peptidoglycan/LPS O-acetylase OafA/YrhL